MVGEDVLSEFGYRVYLNSLQIQEFVAALPKYPLHSNGLIDVPKVLADVVESTIGAIFIDSNSSLETTWEVCPSSTQHFNPGSSCLFLMFGISILKSRAHAHASKFDESLCHCKVVTIMHILSEEKKEKKISELLQPNQTKLSLVT